MSERPIQLVIAYDGTDFGGWQRQKNARSVQEELEKALASMHKHPVTVTGAGRTDAGVHARGQVAGFFTDIETIPAQKFALALNKLLPRDIRIMEASDAPADFHARFDASRRSYRYFFSTDRQADPFSIRYTWQLHRVPRLDILNAMAQVIPGEQDFSAFASAQDPSPSKFRFVESSVFWAEGDRIVYQISANAFLWRMVRSLVGTMIYLEQDADDAARARIAMKRILDSKDRKQAGPTAPPYGLFLWNVEYGERDYGHARR
ncbi:MAG: tRNA pseudouridine(38-40) synthase TruA [Spirochaetia bacterium]|nr:tRNA pseudouridine(38-40) synthase TruA [Spirochaetia bacterium]